MRILSIGEILWDVIGGREYLGGAPFNFCVHAARLGHEVMFLSAVGYDARGELARKQALQLGIDTEFLTQTPDAATGVSYVSNETGQAKHHLPRPAAYDYVALTEGQLARIQEWRPDWLYFGTLLQMNDRARLLTQRLVDRNPHTKGFYDVNLRPDNFSGEIVSEMLKLSAVVKLNEEEFPCLAQIAGLQNAELSRESCQEFTQTYGLAAVCVTKGAAGSNVYRREPYAYVESRGYPVKVSDTVGAGDAFSAAFIHGLDAGWDLEKVCDFANRVGALVASRPGATPGWTIEEALAL
jgi:fructokinase